MSKRDNTSIQPGTTSQVTKKDCTYVDTNSGLKFKNNKKDSTKKVDKKLVGGDAVGYRGNFETGGKLEQFKKEGVEGNLQTNVNVNNLYECKICGKLTKSNFENKTISLTHTVNMLLALQRIIVRMIFRNVNHCINV